MRKYAAPFLRAVTTPRLPEKSGTLHDYVPFYFAPRSPMLLTNNTAASRGDPNFPNAKLQTEIIYLVTYAERIAEQNLPFVFYTHHARMALSECCNSIADLHKIDWDLFFETPVMGAEEPRYAKYWQDNQDQPRWVNRKATRQAEFLVHQHLHWQNISTIGTISEQGRLRVQQILQRFGVTTPVIIRPDWYY